MRQKQLDLLRLHMNPGIGRATLFKLHRHFGCFSAAASTSSRAWQQAGIPADLHAALLDPTAAAFRTMLQKIASLDIRLISYWDDDYPPLLKTIYDPPAVIYVRGSLPGREALAIVGSRKASAAGLEFARELAGKLATQGVCIVSGIVVSTVPPIDVLWRPWVPPSRFSVAASPTSTRLRTPTSIVRSSNRGRSSVNTHPVPARPPDIFPAATALSGVWRAGC